MPFLRCFVAILALVCVFPRDSLAATNSPPRPNIVLCIADDWGWPHAGVYGDSTVKTPNFDRVAREGALFSHAFSAAPSCTPSRAALLTGRAVHQLEEGSVLHGFLPKKFDVYPDILEQAGYAVGSTGKGWGPGKFQEGGRTRNPAGPTFPGFPAFLRSVETNQPFCFWFGSRHPHRPYELNSGARAGLTSEKVRVPAFWPDVPTVRNDVLDYYSEVQRFDQQLGEVLAELDKRGLASNTIVVVTADNGMPFPRAKANLYDAGTRQPLAIRWPAKVAAGKQSHAFVNLYDLAPTFLEAAGVAQPTNLTGKSLLNLLSGGSDPADRDAVFVERERHANVRKGDLGYPMRAIRTKDFLYIKNLRPDRWPAGDPEMHEAVGRFGDVDGSPTKSFILDLTNQSPSNVFFQLCFGKRPAEELYDLSRDPDQIVNVAGKADYKEAQKNLAARLDQWRVSTGDPRLKTDDDRWDRYPYYGGRPKPEDQR